MWLKTELHKKKKKNAVAHTHFCLVVCTCIYFVVSIHLYFIFFINKKKVISLKLGLKSSLRLECINLSLSEMKHDWHRIMFLMGLFLIGGTLVPSSGNIHNCTYFKYFLHYFVLFSTHTKRKRKCMVELWSLSLLQGKCLHQRALWYHSCTRVIWKLNTCSFSKRKERLNSQTGKYTLIGHWRFFFLSESFV